jgi:competence protein ComGC
MKTKDNKQKGVIMKTQDNKQKGITLIALVITIIVLLILAAVSITTLTGENGILGKATTATINMSHATVKEQIILGANDFRIEKTVDRI